MDGVDDDERRAKLEDDIGDLFEQYFWIELDVGPLDSKTIGAELNLRSRFFAADIKDRSFELAFVAGLKEERRLPNARFTPDEDERAWDETAT